MNTPSLPEAVDVAIIGGGIIGAAAAYYLAKSGTRVALLEKGRIAGEQSSRNWGFVRQQGRDVREMPVIMDSLRLWGGLAEEIGEDLGFRRTGIMYVADDAEKMASFEAWIETARAHQLDTKLLTADEVKERLPTLPGRWHGGLYTPSDGRAEPALATPALARAAARAGAHILEQCAVRGIEREGGRVSAVVTEHGLIPCASAVVAGGIWSALFLGSLGITFPQLKIRSSVLRTSPGPAVVEGGLWTPYVALRRRVDGGYTVAHGSATEYPIVPDSFRYMRKFGAAYKQERNRLRFRLDKRFIEEWRLPKHWALDGPSPFESERVMDPAPNRKLLSEAKNSLSRLFPELGEVRVEESWAGLIDVMPDAVPVIGPVAEIPGLFVASGFSGHGFGIGPGAGRLIANMLNGRATDAELTPFRLNRF